MKIFKSALIAVSLLFVFSFSASASSDDVSEEKWDEFLEIVPEGSVSIESTEELLSGVGIDSLMNEIISAIKGNFGGALSFLMLLIGVSVLIAAAESLSELSSGGLSVHVGVGISIVTSLLLFNRLYPLVTGVKDGIKTLSGFFASLLPVLSGISAAAGAANTAAIEALNMNITLSAVEFVSSSLLLPLSFVFFALSLISGVDSRGISSLLGSLRGIFMWILGIVTTVIIGAVSMQTVVSGAKDSAYLRAAKYAASGMIPVVGSTVSSALATLAGGLSYVKSSVGVASVMIIVVVALSPLVSLLLHRAAIAIGISFLQFVDSPGGVRIFSSFKTALDALIAVYSVSIIVYIFEILLFVRSGVGAFG